MKLRNFVAALLAVLCLSAVACGGDNTGDPAKTDASTGISTGAAIGTADQTTGETEAPAGDAADLSAIVDSVKQYYADTVTFVMKADEYSEEVLMYTYGLYDEKYTSAVTDFVLSECDGMSADTFALIKFAEGTDKALIEEAAETMKTEYVNALKSKLSAYNPEEFEAADGYQVKVDDSSILMVISSENTDAIIAAAGK